MVDHAPSERYRKLVQPPRHRVGWLPSISRREKFGVVKILYHFSHNKNVLGMDGRWQSQNSVHVLNLPCGTVRLAVVTMENAMLGMVRHYQRDGWGGRVLVEVLRLTQKGFVVRVRTHGYRGTEGPGAHEFHSWFRIRSWKGRRNAKREDFFQKVTQRTQPGVPRKAVLTEGQRGSCSERGLFSWLFWWSEAGEHLGVSGWNLLLPGGAQSLRHFFLAPSHHPGTQQSNPCSLPTISHQVEDSLGSLERFWLQNEKTSSMYERGWEWGCNSCLVAKT